MVYAYVPSHESDDFSAILKPDITPFPRPRQRSTLAPNFLGLVFILAPHVLTSHVAAVPLVANTLSQTPHLEMRDDQGQGNQQMVSVHIWVPVLVVGAFIVVSALSWCWRRSISAWLSRRRSPSTTTTSAPTTRELTAEQLAGTINGTTTPAAGTGANRTRRTRRPRRTPSQISTTSLPAYAKEPGEQELVIFRGPNDMEDAGMPPATVVMESLSEDGEESLHSRNNSQSSQYPPIPATPIDLPLLQQDDSTANLSHDPQAPGDNSRRSFETLNSSEEASSLMRVTSNLPRYSDPRGEAPPYFDATPEGHHSSAETSALASSSTPPPASPEQVLPRRSGFRTLLHSLPNRLSMHGSAPSHSRAESSLSMISSDNSHAREMSQSRASHRPSISGSGSFLSHSPFRTLSRQRSINTGNLTSPSLISLNSISSPLTHTLTRTEFTYPKAGPTPEQLKLISSRDSFARFAVPYGADAIAYAASTSRQDLDVPPPDFDLDMHATPGPAGPSRLRAISNAVNLQQDAEASPASETASSGAASPETSSPATPMPDFISEADPAVSTSPSSAPSPLPLSPEASETSPPNQAEIATLALPKPSTQFTSNSGAPVSTIPGEAVPVPSTSFRAPSTSEVRLESRASSHASFATAAESMAPRSPSRFELSEDEGDDLEMDRPTTPTISTRHVLEPTDTTIKQSPIAAAGSSQ